MDLSRILVANDLSPNSTAALDAAAQLAKRFHARIDVLHVWQPPLSVGGETLLLRVGPAPQLPWALIEQQVRAQMHRCVRSLERRGIAAAAVVELGDPAEIIVERAADYDLVVLGTHGRTGVARLVAGSVAEAVVRRAPCPVLTVRPGHEPAEETRV
jgi:nucleotide-binding universal stress UspA family protein